MMIAELECPQRILAQSFHDPFIYTRHETRSSGLRYLKSGAALRLRIGELLTMV
jgi:hypothetical protein